ncbi:MAG: MBL fold metallo-hydrolase [Treponema sp.]|jgi:glyoxylase-like metal-dependent hydrolase (beta-lactamase superfamily II)|nr:MBL fold metallo-hydrolase [Treponema sp.]
MGNYRIDRLVLGAIATNCWIVAYPPDGKDGPEGASAGEIIAGLCAVIDPAEQAGLIIAHLNRRRLRPAHILLTHGHFDHLAALPDLAGAYPEALIAVHREDARYLGGGALEVHRESFSAAGGSAAYVDGLWKAMPAPSRLLEDGDRIGPFTVLSLPGHTPGSAGFYLPEENTLFSGDTLFQGDCGRVDLPGGEQGKIEESLKRLLAMDGGIRVLPGHGPDTSIAAERETRFF